MSIEKQILRDLAAGQATANALADTLRLPRQAVEQVLCRLVKDDQITTARIYGILTVYRLKPSVPSVP